MLLSRLRLWIVDAHENQHPRDVNCEMCDHINTRVAPTCQVRIRYWQGSSSYLGAVQRSRRKGHELESSVLPWIYNGQHTSSNWQVKRALLHKWGPKRRVRIFAAARSRIGGQSSAISNLTLQGDSDTALHCLTAFSRGIVLNSHTLMSLASSPNVVYETQLLAFVRSHWDYNLLRGE